MSVDGGSPLAVSSYNATITPPGVTGGYARQYIVAGRVRERVLHGVKDAAIGARRL